MTTSTTLRAAVWSAQGPPTVDRYVWLLAHTKHDYKYVLNTTVGSLAFIGEPDLQKHPDAQANTPGANPIFQVAVPPGTYHVHLETYPYQPGHPNPTEVVSRQVRLRRQAIPSTGDTIVATAAPVMVPRKGALQTIDLNLTGSTTDGFGTSGWIYFTVDLVWPTDTPISGVYYPLYFADVTSLGGTYYDSGWQFPWQFTIEGYRTDI